MVESKDERTVV